MYSSLRTALDRATARGGRRIGWKVGLTDPGLRSSLGAPDGVVGYLLEDTVVRGGRAQFPIDADAAFGAEPELALWADGDAVVAVAPACEVLAVAGPLDDLDAILDGNVWHRAALVGAAVPWRPDLLDGVEVVVDCNGRRRDTGRPGDVAGDLGATAAFVARSVRELDERLSPDDLVLSGLLLPSPVWVGPGDHLVVDFGPLGRLEVGFTPTTRSPSPEDP